MRKLASIKTINDIQPIEGKDRIVLATVDGWNVVVKKDELAIGDKCVYIEIDSVLPERAEFEFLRKNNFRIKTMKMDGCISQGICFPMSILPDGDYDLEQDVTEILGIKQYEPTMDIEKEETDDSVIKKKYPKWLMKHKWFKDLILPQKQVKGFPDFISKTDEIRIQSCTHYLKNKNPMVVTEKIDGQSGTFFLKKEKGKHFWNKGKYEFGVCSRNIRLLEKDNSSYWNVVKKYNIEKVLRDNIGDLDFIAIQGECVAPKVQKNKYKVTEPDLYVFNVITSENGRLGTEVAMDFCSSAGLKFVPVLDTHYVLPDTVQEILDYAHGKSKLYDTLREGVVIRTKDGKQSFKVVDPLFLIKYDE